MSSDCQERDGPSGVRHRPSRTPSAVSAADAADPVVPALSESGAAVTTAGFGSTRYSRPEITMVATQPRPYSPMTLFFASGPVNQSEVVNISPAARPIAQAATAAGEKPPRYQ